MADPDLLLERDAEVQAIGAAVESAMAGSGAFVAVQGGPGVGKTRLLAEARVLAAKAGMWVLPARASELERGFAFGLVRQLFDPVLARLPPAERIGQLAGSARPAAAVLGELGPGQPPAGDFAVLHALFWLTTNLTQRQPLALMCDDVHWADESSLRFLTFLLPRLDGLAVLVVATLRAGEGGRSTPLLNRLTTDPACTVLSPAPLRLPAASVLLQEQLGGQADPAFALACHTAAGGNPLLLQELARAASAAGVAPAAANARQVVPLGSQAIARRVELWLARFPPDRLVLARAVAVLGGVASLATAASLAGLDHDAALDAADDLERAEILRRANDNAGSAGGADGVSYVHPLVQAAVYDRMTPAERSASHRAAAHMLTTAGAPAERVAAHLQHVGDPDQQSVAILRQAAVEALGRGAPDAALTYLQRCLDQTTDQRERLDLLVQAGPVAALTDVAVSIRLFDEALRLATDPVQRADIAFQLGRAWLDVDRWPLAQRLYQEALTWLPPGDDDLRRRLQAGLVLFEYGYLDPDVADPAGLVASLRDLPPADTVGSRMLDCIIAQWEYLTGDPRAVDRAVRGVADGLLIEQGEGDPALGGAWQVLAAAEQDEGLRSVNASVALAYETGSASALVFALGVRGLVWLWRGELAEAVADQTAATQAANIAGRTLYHRFFQPWLAMAQVERGELAGAEVTLRAISVPDPLPPSGPWFHYLLANAMLLRELGRFEEALQAATDAGRYVRMHGFSNPAFVAWRSEAALCLHALGQDEQARVLAGEELELASGWPSARARGRALRVLGLLTRGRDGVDLLRESVRVLQGSTARLELAKALADLGSTLRRGGYGVQARPLLHRALDLADTLGAVVLAERTRGELRAAGARPRRTALTGPASLTPSERRVAELAAAGHTNRDIAQQLFVTPKTVEVHLSSAYRKLDISRRDHLAAALLGAQRRHQGRDT